MTLISPLGKLVTELRDDAGVAAITERVRGAVPGPGDVVRKVDGTTRKPTFQAFVVVVQLSLVRDRRAPVQRGRYAVRCYGETPTRATDLRMACSDAIHMKGPRLYSTGLGIYQTIDDGGGEAEEDPVTRQPLETLIVDLIATSQAVAS